MKSGQQKKSLDRFIYESMGEKQYLISCLDDELFKKALKGFRKERPEIDSRTNGFRMCLKRFRHLNYSQRFLSSTCTERNSLYSAKNSNRDSHDEQPQTTNSRKPRTGTKKTAGTKQPFRHRALFLN